MPAAHAAARLELVADEEPGTMRHFTTALLLGDLINRLHATFLVSVASQFDESVPLASPAAIAGATSRRRGDPVRW